MTVEDQGPSLPSPIADRTSPFKNAAIPAILAAILLGTFFLKLHNLGHASIKPLDEVFHGIVAQNFLKHPLTPTLNDGPAIPTRPGDWQNGTIWLHKPPMGMWQIALSYLILGINTFALRLPSAILSTLAVWLTYLIGKELLDPLAGLIAAALQAFNAPILMIVHGYVFSDHVDIALLFWTELSIWFFARALRTDAKWDLILCGVAQGLAFLSKSYPALIVTGLCAAAWVMGRPNLKGKSLAIVLASTAVTVLPWLIYAYIRWPEALTQESTHALRHMTEDIEQWAGPWHRVVFDYWARIFYLYYPTIIAGVVVAIIHARRREDGKLVLILLWIGGVLAPHLVAQSKTMTATLIGWPGMWLVLGYLIAQAIRGEPLALGTWLGGMLMALLVRGGNMPAERSDVTIMETFTQVLQHQGWILWQPAAALAVGALIWRVYRPSARPWLIGVASLAMLVLAVRWWGDGRVRGYAYLAVRVTQIPGDQPDFKSLGVAIRDQLPASAVLLVDEKTKLENKLIQFYADRTSYPVNPQQLVPLVKAVVDAGGKPYLITPSADLDFTQVIHDAPTSRYVYELISAPPTQPAQALAAAAAG
jgi:4-amino-4-deoxy-L-arabinose transferase